MPIKVLESHVITTTFSSRLSERVVSLVNVQRRRVQHVRGAGRLTVYKGLQRHGEDVICSLAAGSRARRREAQDAIVRLYCMRTWMLALELIDVNRYRDILELDTSEWDFGWSVHNARQIVPRKSLGILKTQVVEFAALALKYPRGYSLTLLS